LKNQVRYEVASDNDKRILQLCLPVNGVANHCNTCTIYEFQNSYSRRVHGGISHCRCHPQSAKELSSRSIGEGTPERSDKAKVDLKRGAMMEQMVSKSLSSLSRKSAENQFQECNDEGINNWIREDKPGNA